jgi:hypothetical protein
MPLINDPCVPDYIFSGPELPLDEGAKARLFWGSLEDAPRRSNWTASMKIGILGFITETSIDTMTFARRAESLGFDTFYLPKHPKFPWSANRPIRRAPTALCRRGSHTLSILSLAWRRRRPGLPMAD